MAETGDYSSSWFIPPSGLHDPSCQFLCRDPRPGCVHACSVCDVKRTNDERRTKEIGRVP